jgi:hypothetical protein
MGTDLSVRFLGRKIKPYAFAVSLTMFVLTYMMFNHLAVGEFLRGWQGNFAAVLAGASAVWLSVGWWWQRQALLEWGLLLAAGGWMVVTASLAFEFGVFYHNTLLAFCWVVASVGSWFLERAQGE